VSSPAQKKIAVFDTGLRTGRENIAHDQAMIDAHVDGHIGDSFKFIHFKPCALIGRHQALSQELKLDACERLGVQTVRRVTGGGAIYLDEGQLGWALVCNRKTVGGDLTQITKTICTAAAKGLSTLGIDAQFRPRNDIEVNGKKISGTGGFFDGNTLMFQGTVLIDLSPKTMMAVLNVPAHKLEKRALKSAENRVTCLRALLDVTPTLEQVQASLMRGFEDVLGVSMVQETPPDMLDELAQNYHDEEIGTEEFVTEINNPDRRDDVFVGNNEAGNVSAYVRLEGVRNDRLREVIFTGDIFVTPPRTLMDLEASLRGVKIDEIATKTDMFFGAAHIDLLSVDPREFSQAILRALP
jgi:lipoate-protein ligase A